LLGSAVHEVLERAEDKHAPEIQEERLTVDLQGWTISGKPDVYAAEEKTMYDWKFTSVWAGVNEVKPEWVQQINMLSYIYRKAGFPVEQGKIVTIYRDWSKNKAKFDTGNYPKRGAETHNIPMWTDEEVEAYMIERIKLHQESENIPDADLPLCTEKERWQRQDTYAVMKNKNKRATRVLDTREEAEDYIENIQNKQPKDKFRIEFRPGESIRCENYCPVKDYCNQYLKIIGHEDFLKMMGPEDG